MSWFFAEPKGMQRCCLSRLALACYSANWEEQRRVKHPGICGK